jgi:hypothetical protein
MLHRYTKGTTLARRIATDPFVTFGIAALAAGVCGAFATAFFDGLVAPFVVLAGYVLFITGCAILLTSVVLKHLRGAKRLLLVIAVVTLIIVVLPFYSALMLYRYPGDRLHFLMDLPHYQAYVDRLPRNGKRFAEFNWGGMLFASSGISYDETDEVALPFGHQSAEWRARMKNTDLTCGGNGPVGTVEPMGGHYYLTAFGC